MWVQEHPSLQLNLGVKVACGVFCEDAKTVKHNCGVMTDDYCDAHALRTHLATALLCFHKYARVPCIVSFVPIASKNCAHPTAGGVIDRYF